MRDLGQTLAHVPDAEIEIGEGLETPAAKWGRCSSEISRLGL